jgi:NADH-quinone oxidoreductase subunit N
MNVLDLASPSSLMMAIVPELVLMGGCMILLLFAAWRKDSDAHQRSVGVASLVLVALTIGAVIWSAGRFTVVPGGPVTADNFRWAMDIVILIGAGLTVALAMDDNRRESVPTPETHVLVLLAASGMMLLAAATDMMIIFLGIELMSISVYALAGINRRSPRGAEGALKYFLLGAFATAFLLYGIALVYGATGSTNIDGIANAIRTLGVIDSPLLMVGLAMLVIGFGFKVAVAPFHMWAPDVYDGAPSAITAYMAATVKAAAFATFMRVWIHSFFGMGPEWYNAIYFVAVASMIVGNAIGLVQKNLKRMLAYSSIGHAGYITVLLATGTEQATSALIFYLLAYSLATFGAFAAIVSISQPGKGTVMIDELSGLWKRRPWLALGMGVMMLSLLGFPFFGGAGFFAKWYVLQAALRAPVPQTMLAVFIVLTSVLSAGYYLHVVMVMFMKPAPEGAAAIETPRSGGMTRGVLVATTVLTILLGIAPEAVVRWTNQSRITRPIPTTAGLRPGGATVAPVMPPQLPIRR